MIRKELHEGWTVEAVGDLKKVPAEIRGRKIPATVPGCVHTDLLGAGLIEDPYLDRNEDKVQWIGLTDWRYSCAFEIEDSPHPSPLPRGEGAGILAHERVDLACDGLDTVATIELNGQVVGTSDNMHLPRRIDVKSVLKAGRNELAITFSSALRYAQAQARRNGRLPHANKHPYNQIRKMACNFGWDWGPIVITCGIWRPIRLEAWNTVRIASVQPLLDRMEGGRAILAVQMHFEFEKAQVRKAATTYSVQLTLRKHPENLTVCGFDSGVLGDGDSHTFRMEIKDPQIWWPRGHGAQPVYELDAVVFTGADTKSRNMDRWSGRIGLRTTKLNTEPDAVGSKFQIEVNGKPVFVRGANWIPDDCFLSRVTKERYRERLEQTVAAGINMLRVWGGGIYESDDFYDLCDEMGILVWQDFLFSCAAYPEPPALRESIEAEARHHVARLSRHPSLVLWNGANECIWGYFDWGWKFLLAPLGKAWGLNYYLDALPAAVKGIDPTRPYWANTPWSGSMDIHPLDDAHGTKHVWDVWNKVDYRHYRDYTPRFAAEFGWQALPNIATLLRAIPEGQRSMTSAAMRKHQRARDGVKKLRNGLATHFPLPANANLTDWVYVTQLNQARAVTLGVEWYRSLSPVCGGTMYWQINDCWPVISWSAIDGDGRKKLLWYATRRFYTDRLLTIEPEPGGTLVVYAINDSDEAWRGSVEVKRMRFDGTVAHADQTTFDVAPRGKMRVAALGAKLAQPEDPRSEFIVAQVGGDSASSGRSEDAKRCLWFFDVDKVLAYPAPEFDAELMRPAPGKYELKITARTLLRDLALLADVLDPGATVEEQLVTLLPGERFTFRIHSAKELTREQLIAPQVLYCANRFGSPRLRTRKGKTVNAGPLSRAD